MYTRTFRSHMKSLATAFTEAEISEITGGRDKNPLVHLTCMVLHTKASRLKNFWEVVNGNIPTKQFRTAVPLAVPSLKNSEQVIIYPNLLLNWSFLNTSVSISDILNNISPALFFELYAPTLDKYSEDMAHEKRSLRWADGRMKRTLLRTEVTTMGRYIQNHLIESGAATDKQLQSWSQSIINDLLPVELEFCNSVEDWAVMYGPGGPGSCMSKEDFDRKSLHPTSFYHFMPSVEGAFIRRSGKVVARSVLVNKKIVRIYSSSTRYSQLFLNLLIKAGYREGSDTLHITEPFEVRANAEGRIGWPYFDFPVGGLSELAATKEKNVFIFGQNLQRHGYKTTFRLRDLLKGHYIDVKDLEVVTCSCCGVDIHRGQKRHSSEDGHVFCSTECYRERGYEYGHQGTGRTILRMRNRLLFCLFSRAYYTTLNAATASSGHGEYTFVVRDPDLFQTLEAKYILKYWGERDFPDVFIIPKMLVDGTASSGYKIRGTKENLVLLETERN